MKDLINKLKSPKTQAAFMSYLRAVLASAVSMAIALAADVAPEYAVLIGALAAPAAKWADKTEKEYGLGSKEQPLNGSKRPLERRNPLTLVIILGRGGLLSFPEVSRPSPQGRYLPIGPKLNGDAYGFALLYIHQLLT